MIAKKTYIAKLSLAPASAPAEQTELALFSTNPATHPPGKVYLEAVAN